MIPGENILSDALEMLGTTDITYYQFDSVAPNAAGIDVTTYKTGVTITSGSVQPIKRTLYREMGLDYSKSYVNWYVPNLDATAIARSNSGDVLQINGRNFQLESSTPWYSIDGWSAFLCVDIGTGTVKTHA